MASSLGRLGLRKCIPCLVRVLLFSLPVNRGSALINPTSVVGYENCVRPTRGWGALLNHAPVDLSRFAARTGRYLTNEELPVVDDDIQRDRRPDPAESP